MQIVINPGSGPVADATEEQATENVRHFITDLMGGYAPEYEPRRVRIPDEDERGRFGFLLWWRNRCTLIEMPGIPLERVRYMQNPDQDVWQFPRLYVNGSSWLWCFALDSARSDLYSEEE